MLQFPEPCLQCPASATRAQMLFLQYQSLPRPPGPLPDLTGPLPDPPALAPDSLPGLADLPGIPYPPLTSLASPLQPTRPSLSAPMVIPAFPLFTPTYHPPPSSPVCLRRPLSLARLLNPLAQQFVPTMVTPLSPTPPAPATPDLDPPLPPKAAD
jgi:hypothetical protein